MNISRRLLLMQLLMLSWVSCRSIPNQKSGALVIGIISYDQGEQILERYTEFKQYLAEKIGTHIELEPAFNENKAIERIQSHGWSMVVAPPGIAAIAIAQAQYAALFPLQETGTLQSVLVVKADSPIQNLSQLAGQSVALGEMGSATGYYLPLYNLYGLTLAEVLFAPTPKTVLEWVAQGKAAAGALSLSQLTLESPQFSSVKFRVLFSDPHPVPKGVILVAPEVERNLQERIRKVMADAPLKLTQQAGYSPDEIVPDYKYMITVVERVKSITAHLQEKPVRLF